MAIKLCFSGKMKSGKDTAANFMLQEHGGTSLHIFASGYQFVSGMLLYGLRGKTIDPEHKTKFERWMLQQVGSLGRKLFGKDIWLNKTVKIIENMESNVFITGVRFPNEIKRLKEIGVESVHVTRPLDIRLAAGAFNVDHETETGLDNFTDFDYVIENNKSLSEFHFKLKVLPWSKQVKEVLGLDKISSRDQNWAVANQGEMDKVTGMFSEAKNLTAEDVKGFGWQAKEDQTQFGKGAETLEEYQDRMWAPKFATVPALPELATENQIRREINRLARLIDTLDLVHDPDTVLPKGLELDEQVQKTLKSIDKILNKIAAENKALADDAEITAAFDEIEAKEGARRARKRERDNASRQRRRFEARMARLKVSQEAARATKAKKKKKKTKK